MSTIYVFDIWCTYLYFCTSCIINKSSNHVIGLNSIDVKKFFYVFYFGHVLTFFNVFYFPNVCYFSKNVAKFRAASRLTRSTFKITAKKQTYDYSVLCRMIWNTSLYSQLPRRPFLGHQAWSWTTLRRSNVFITFTNVFLKFLSRFYVFYFYLNVFTYMRHGTADYRCPREWDYQQEW